MSRSCASGVFRDGAGRAEAIRAGAGLAGTLLDWSTVNGISPGLMGTDAALWEDGGLTCFSEPVDLVLSSDFVEA